MIFFLCAIITLSELSITKITITNAFQNILDILGSYHKPSLLWLHKGSELYNINETMVKEYDKEMHSTNNERKPVVAKRFIRTLNNKIYKYMTPIFKRMYIYKLHDTANQYNHTYYRTSKIKPFDA